MAQRYRGGILKKPAAETPWLVEARAIVAQYVEKMDHYLVHLALETALGLATKCNAYIEAQAPWKLAKDPAQAGQLDEVLYHLAESLRLLSILIAPVLPEAARGMAAQLSVAPDALLAAALDPASALADGHVLGKPTPLFPRIEAEAKE
jgi:methionyl-tRNA synthetase